MIRPVNHGPGESRTAVNPLCNDCQSRCSSRSVDKRLLPAGAVLLEQNDEWLLQHRYMQIEGMAELTPRQLDVELGKLPPMAA